MLTLLLVKDVFLGLACGSGLNVLGHASYF